MQSVIEEWMSMPLKQWRNNVERGKPICSENIPSQFHFVYHTSHIDWRGLEIASPRWLTRDQRHKSGTVVHCVRILEVSSGIRGRNRSASCRVERKCFCDSAKNSIAFRSSEALEYYTQIAIPTIEESRAD